MPLENAIKFKANNLKIMKLGMFLQKIKKSYFQRLATDGGAALSSLEVAMNVKRSLIGLQLPIVMAPITLFVKRDNAVFF